MTKVSDLTGMTDMVSYQGGIECLEKKHDRRTIRQVSLPYVYKYDRGTRITNPNKYQITGLVLLLLHTYI